MNDTILEYVSRLIQKKSKFPRDCNIAEFNYIDSGYVDSIAIIKFVLDLEAKFDVELSDDDLISPQFRTVGGLLAIIDGKLRAKQTRLEISD